MFSITSAELEKLEPLPDIVNCPHCKQAHQIKFGTKEDGTKSDLAFYKCAQTEKMYLCGIDGKHIV